MIVTTLIVWLSLYNYPSLFDCFPQCVIVSITVWLYSSLCYSPLCVTVSMITVSLYPSSISLTVSLHHSLITVSFTIGLYTSLYHFISHFIPLESSGPLSARPLQCRNSHQDNREQARCGGLPDLDLLVSEDDTEPQLLQLTGHVPSSSLRPSVRAGREHYIRSGAV